LINFSEYILSDLHTRRCLTLRFWEVVPPFPPNLERLPITEFSHVTPLSTPIQEDSSTQHGDGIQTITLQSRLTIPGPESSSNKMRRDSISTFLSLTLPAISLARVISSAATTHTAVLADKTRSRTRTREKYDLGIQPVSSIGTSSIHVGSAKFASTRGGGDSVASKPPSIYWAILHNWLYFFSLGFNVINIQFLAREVVDGDFKAKPSAKLD